MPKFKLSVTNGHYIKGSIIELPLITAKLFENLKWGSIQEEKESIPKIKSKTKTK